MPNYSITTTIRPRIFAGERYLDSVSFKNGSTAGILYFLNRANRQDVVSSTNFDFPLAGGESINFNRLNHGEGIDGPWDVISDTAGGVILAIVPLYNSKRRI